MIVILIIIIIALAIIALDAFFEGAPPREHAAQPILAPPAPADRKLSAKRSNETIKLSATCANNLGVGIIIGGLVGPTAARADIDPLWYSGVFLAAFALHMLGRFILGYLKSED